VATGRVVLFAQNVDGDDATSPGFAYVVPPRGGLTIVDPLAQVGLSGNASLKVIPDNEVRPGVVARFWNEQDVDGNGGATTQLSQYSGGVAESDLLLPGDVATFQAPDSSLVGGVEAFRWNLFLYAEAVDDGEPPEALFELYSAAGQLVASVEMSLPDHGGRQFNNLVRSLFGEEPEPHDVLRVVWLEGRGWAEASPVQNNRDLPGADDGGSQKPVVERLMEELVAVVTTSEIGANEPVGVVVAARSRPGTTIASVDVEGWLAASYDGNGSNTFQIGMVETPEVAGDLVQMVTVTVASEDGDFSRSIVSSAVHVSPEIDHILGTAELAQQIFEAREELAVVLSAYNVWRIDEDCSFRQTYEDAFFLLTSISLGGTPDSVVSQVRIFDTEPENRVLMRTGNGAEYEFIGLTEAQVDVIVDVFVIQ